ncbi:protein BCCIP-like protein [Iris pallida]|uniref:Protein BCCIP-like protein n=1 Tax=Iris pallida TaxID=29817 RepID=A0AAX6H7F8_IRIPA|nr:protein BCCIP-like protein [Iris pallida]
MDDRRRPVKAAAPPSMPIPTSSPSLLLRHMATSPTPGLPHTIPEPHPDPTSQSPNPQPNGSKPHVPPPPEEEGEEDEEAPMEMVQADFGFFDPKPGDFGG